VEEKAFFNRRYMSKLLLIIIITHLESIIVYIIVLTKSREREKKDLNCIILIS
jgi:hypothetical protein